jgi:hypothetical protein
MLQYGFYMALPYLSSALTLFLLSSERYGAVLRWPLTALFNDVKLGISVAAALYHWLQSKLSPLHKAKATYWFSQAWFELMNCLTGESLLKSAYVADALSESTAITVPTRSFAQAFESTVSGFNPWHIILFGQTRPCSDTVNTFSDSMLNAFFEPKFNASWYATPWSISQGLVARYQAMHEVMPDRCAVESWQISFGDRQCPAQFIDGVMSLLGDKLGVLNPLVKTDRLAVVSAKHGKAAVVFSQVRDENLSLEPTFMLKQFAALSGLLQFAAKGMAVELTQA